MPSGLLNADTTFPNVEGKRTDQALNEIVNYLYMLLENLKYSLANIDRDNFNDKGFEDMAKIINKPILIELKNTNGEVLKLTIEAGRLSSEISNANGEISAIKQTVNGIHLGVSNGYESSTIQLFVNGVAVSSQDITLNGMVTFNSLRTPGATVINGSNITTGTIKAINIEGVNIVGSNIVMDTKSSKTGEIEFRGHTGYLGEISIEGDDKIRFRTGGDVPLKMISGAGISMEANYSVFIEAQHAGITLRAKQLYLDSDNIYVGMDETLKDYIKRIAKG